MLISFIIFSYYAVNTWKNSIFYIIWFFEYNVALCWSMFFLFVLRWLIHYLLNIVGDGVLDMVWDINLELSFQSFSSNICTNYMKILPKLQQWVPLIFIFWLLFFSIFVCFFYYSKADLNVLSGMSPKKPGLSFKSQQNLLNLPREWRNRQDSINPSLRKEIIYPKFTAHSTSQFDEEGTKVKSPTTSPYENKELRVSCARFISKVSRSSRSDHIYWRKNESQ